MSEDGKFVWIDVYTDRITRFLHLRLTTDYAETEDQLTDIEAANKGMLLVYRSEPGLPTTTDSAKAHAFLKDEK